MLQNRLFEVPAPPKRQPPEYPTFWVRHLVLVSGLSADAQVIRDIRFRRGLNIVRVAEPPRDYSGPIGHSVGKTLLTRFIRYCLGERYYATDEVATRVVETYPAGYVVAGIVIGQDDWTVARPFRVGGKLQSLSLQSADWQSLLASQENCCPYEAFATAISDAVIGNRPVLQLPDAKRAVRWADVLGWLSRDQECNFTHYNIWRSKDAHSDSREHTRSDCSLIAAWALGLIDPQENELRAAHQRLLAQKDAADRQKREGETAQAAYKRILSERFPDLSQEENDDLFSKSAATEAADRVRQLKGLQAEMDSPPGLAQLKSEVADLRNQQFNATGKLERLKAQIQVKESQLETEAAANTASAYSPGCLCPGKPSTCPRNVQLMQDAEMSRQIETAQRIGRELDSLCAERGQATGELDAIISQLRGAESRYDAEEVKHRDNLRKLSESIGRWEAHVEEVQSYSAARARGDQAMKELGKLELQIARSSEAQRKAREVQVQHVDQLSREYADTLKVLLGQEISAEFELDALGVRPKPGVELKTNGQAMATLATVIGFDIVCLRASIRGLVDLPRFLIHDSPKASDLESALYDRVYEPLLQLDAADARCEPNFQYIITTTTAPPQAAARNPYVCLTLDARTPEGHLLRAKF